MLTLLLKCARLHMLMAWFSTLGGAHSQLGDSLYEHVSTPPPPPPPHPAINSHLPLSIVAIYRQHKQGFYH